MNTLTVKSSRVRKRINTNEYAIKCTEGFVNRAIQVNFMTHIPFIGPANKVDPDRRFVPKKTALAEES